MNNTFKSLNSTHKIAFAALALATIASFAGTLKFAEQQAVKQEQQSLSAQREVRTLEPIIVTAKRDIRQVARVEVIGHRSDVLAANGGTLRSSTQMLAAPAKP